MNKLLLVSAITALGLTSLHAETPKEKAVKAVNAITATSGFDEALQALENLKGSGTIANLIVKIRLEHGEHLTPAQNDKLLDFTNKKLNESDKEIVTQIATKLGERVGRAYEPRIRELTEENARLIEANEKLKKDFDLERTFMMGTQKDLETKLSEAQGKLARLKKIAETPVEEPKASK